MQNIFDLRNQLISDYASYIRSFLQIRDPAIRTYVEQQLQEGMLWPEPLIQLNPLFAPGTSIDDLITEGILHWECASIFRTDKSDRHPAGKPLHLHHHQAEAIRIAHSGASYVLTTGTGSGKSLAYMIPIVDRILRNGPGRGIQAIVVYPMNALANSQKQELEKFLCKGYSSSHGPVTFARYTGQEREEERQQIVANPPDILLTNYVILELILTRTAERRLLHSTALQFLVLDELHTYRGRQGADVALLVRRVRDRLAMASLQCVGTSATLAGEGIYEERQAEVASMATQIFGTAIEPTHVIGEKLVRTTRHVMQDDAFCSQLTQRVQDSSWQPPKTYHDFIADPLSIWIEHTFGVTEEEGRIVRTKPRSISGPQGAARDLSELTGVSMQRCVEAIQEGLLAGYTCEPDPQTGRPPFAFRLHQFISKGDTMYASLEEPQRYLTLQRQYYLPGDRSKVLLPLVFCRECGQEYYCVRLREDHFLPHELNDQLDDEGPAGFLYHSLDHPWSDDEEELVERLPDDWLEEYAGGTRVKKGHKKDLPQPVRVGLNGERRAQEGECREALDCYFVSAPFRFCLHCGVSYGARQTSDFAKLASLSSEGRSTATTILSLSTIRHLREAPQQTIPPKLLSFTDNRQDASLQAGHFNDFIEVGVLRAALYHAVKKAGPAGIEHDTLMQHVFDALALPPTLYASEPAAKYQKLADTNQALRNVLGYRLYRNLKRGWRITSPNLEQCGLLTIKYHSLEELSRDEGIWSECHPALCTATPEIRQKVSKALLDYMRRELAIKVEYLDQGYQERIQRQSSQHLITPWALDENETPVYATILFPRASRGNDYGGNVYLSARGGFGQYLRRRTTFPDYRDRLHLEDTKDLISQLLEGLKEAGLVERVVEPEGEGDTPGYQVPASAMTWLAGEGTAFQQ